VVPGVKEDNFASKGDGFGHSSMTIIRYENFRATRKFSDIGNISDSEIPLAKHVSSRVDGKVNEQSWLAQSNRPGI
jgi:hypothetical protein